MFDAEMMVESQATVVCISAIFHLRNISRIRPHLITAATEQVVHAYVTRRLDVGNRACKSRARKRGWGQLGAGGPYSPC